MFPGLTKLLTELRSYYYDGGDRWLPHTVLFAKQMRRLYGDAPSYLDVLAFLHNTYRFDRYLEIGIEHGKSLGLSKARTNYGVDPAFAIQQPLVGTFSLFRTTSDAFFKEYSGDKFDFIFIDGLHVAAQASKDLYNSLRALAPNGLIALHDTVPLNLVVASSTRWTSLWAGDVYRALVPYLQHSSKNFLTLLVPPTGLTLVRAPEELLNQLDAPLLPCRLSHEACLEIVLASSQKVRTSSDLSALLQGFYGARRLNSQGGH